MKFKFKAKNLTGQEMSGEREAFDRQSLVLTLRNEGFMVTSVEVIGKSKHHWLSKIGITAGRVKLREKVIFASNLGAMLGAGLPLSRALSVFERQTTNNFFKKVLNDLMEQINMGKSLSGAMAAHKGVFPNVFISMVGAGESSGTLTESLKLVGNQLEKSYELKRKIKGAMIYPAIIVSLIIAVGILMMIFVVPVLVQTFKDLNVELPLPTRIIIFISDNLSAHYLILFFVTFVIGTGLTFGSRTKTGKILMSKFVLKLPAVGRLIRQYNSAMVMRTVSSLISAGVPLVESIQITSTVVSNTEYQKVLSGSLEAIERGVTLSQVFKAREDLFPPLVGEMTEVGEEAGELANMILRGALFFEGEVDSATKNLSTIIEPVLLILIGSAVGFFALSMIGPIYSLTEAI